MVISQDILQRNKHNVTFSEDAKQALMAYNWPGNVVQLENVIENALIITKNTEISLYDLPLDIINERYVQRSNDLFIKEDIKINNQILQKELKEYNKILSSIKDNRGNVKTVAKELNIPISTLYRKLTKYKINPKDYK